MVEKDEAEEKPGLWTRFANYLKGNSEEDVYKRRIIDKRIERYLDDNFNNYVDEYGMVREVDLKVYDERYDDLVERVDGLNSFVREADAEIGGLEHRLKDVEAASKRRKRA